MQQGDLMSAISGTMPASTQRVAEQPQLAINEIQKKISSIDALQIEWIGREIGWGILNSLGPVNQARIAQKVAQVRSKEEGPHADMMRRLELVAARSAIDAGKGLFLSETDASQFLLAILWPMKEQIRNAFAFPENFLSRGTSFKISDYEPVGVVKEVAKKMGMQLTLLDVPLRGYFTLKLDQARTQEQSELVFSLIQQSDGVVFETQTFTLKALETKFGEAHQ